MKVLVKRIAKKETYCIGKLYIDGEYICDTIEDKDRGLKQEMPLSEIKEKKVYGKTAIPTGLYDLTLNVVSPRLGSKPYFQKVCNGKVPRILNVPGFDGVLLHPGNTEEDSYGCLILGLNKAVGKVLESRATFEKVYKILKKGNDKGEKITIEII